MVNGNLFKTPCMQLTDAWRYRPTVIEQTDQSRQIIEVQTAVLD